MGGTQHPLGPSDHVVCAASPPACALVQNSLVGTVLRGQGLTSYPGIIHPRGQAPARPRLGSLGIGSGPPSPLLCP